jgi:nucleoid-associated protein YgaU
MRSKPTLAAVVTTIGGLALAVSGFAEEFGYRDLAPARRNAPATDAPLIPKAARGPVLASVARPAPKDGGEDLMPLALASGSEAARIFQRHNTRVGRISALFGKLKDAAREEEESRRVADEQRRQATEARARRQAELRRQQELEEARVAAEQQRIAEQARARAEQERRRKDEEARRRIERQATPGRASVPSPTTRRLAQAPVPAARQARAKDEYIVQPGDSLIKIARHHYGDPKGWTKIMEANGLNRESTIRVGDTLRIPSYTAQKPRGRTARLAANAASEPRLDYSKYEYKLYNVQPGDTLGHIAARFYSDVRKQDLIKKYNPKALGGPLKAGEKILVPLPRSQAHDERYEQARRGVF